MSDLPQRVIWINGLPRSGTSWLSQIIDSAQEVEFRMAPLFSFQFRNTMKPDESEKDWRRFFNEVYESSDEWMAQKERRRTGAFPIFTQKLDSPPILAIKDVRHHQFIPHLLKLKLDIHVVHIIRDPRAAIYSWLNNAKEFPADADPMENWRSGKVRKINESEYWGFEDWIKLTEQYLRLKAAYPENVTIVRYEHLVEDPLEETRKLFAHLRLDLLPQTENFLKRSTESESEDPFSVFKTDNVLYKWKGQLQPEIIRSIEKQLRSTDLEQFLFKI